MEDPSAPRAIPISSPKSHPIVIDLVRNDLMGAWDIQLTVGNFPTKEAAERAGKQLQKIMQRQFGASANRLQ